MFCVTATWNMHQYLKCILIFMSISNQGRRIWFWTPWAFQCFAEASYQMFIISSNAIVWSALKFSLLPLNLFPGQSKQSTNHEWKCPLGKDFVCDWHTTCLLISCFLRQPRAKQRTCEPHFGTHHMFFGFMSRYCFVLLIPVSTSWVSNHSDDDGVWLRSCGK